MNFQDSNSPNLIQGKFLGLLNLQDREFKSILAEISGPEWDRLVSLAEQQRFMPLLFDRLRGHQDLVPIGILERLREDYFRNSLRNMLFTHELELILDWLKSAEVPVILLKGAHLANAIYPEPGLHPMADLDLLLRKDDILKAIQTMETNGYTADRPFWMNVDGDLHYHAPVMSRNGILVELHWNLTRDSNLETIDVEGIWQRSIEFELGSVRARTLGLSDLILHLAIHIAYGHRFHHQLLSFYDLDRVIRKFASKIDWGEVSAFCEEWQAERGTCMVFLMVRRLFNTPIPDSTIEEIRPSDWKDELLEYATTSLFQEEPVLSENYVRMMRGRTPAEKIRGLCHGLFPSRGILATEYGLPLTSWKIPLLYPQFALKRVRKYWRYAWRMVRGDRRQEKESQSAKELRDWLRV